MLGKCNANNNSTPKVATTKRNSRKYDVVYLAVGFASTMVRNAERPQCVLCSKY